MVEVNEELTRRVAELARLELSDSEVKTFTGQLSEILKYVEQLQKLNVSGVEPLTHPLEPSASGGHGFMRDDVVRPSPVDENGKPKVLKSAPDTLYDGFKVPPII